MRYSTVRIEVLPNLRHAEIFQISTIQKPLTRPGVKLDEKMSICSSTPSTLARSRGEMDVILSVSFKMTAEIEIRKHKLMYLRPPSRRRCVGYVSHMFFHCHEIRLHCFLLSVAWF